jgi:hypothetical protein
VSYGDAGAMPEVIHLNNGKASAQVLIASRQLFR